MNYEVLESQTNTVAECVSALVTHADNIGLFDFICRKILNFSHEEVEFYIPQLCQILVVVETEAVALEDMLVSLAARHPHLALVSFWQLQAHLTDLSDDPESYGFQVARRVLNALQYVLFNACAPERKMRENTGPALVLAGSVLAAFGMPKIGEYIGPLASSQGKKQRAIVFQLAKRVVSQSKLAQNTKLNAKRIDTVDVQTLEENASYRKERPQSDENQTEKAAYEMLMNDDTVTVPFNNSTTRPRSVSGSALFSRRALSTPEFVGSVSHASNVDSDVASIKSATSIRSEGSILAHKSSHAESAAAQSIPLMTTPAKIKLLKANYFQCETQFAIALQQISARLGQVPKAARLTTLKAELSLLNRDLPAEVDIPTLLPASKQLKLHKIVRITPNEAAVLNSAEKVPFLLLIEYLSNEVDFDPASSANINVLKMRADKKYIFDTGTQLSTPTIVQSSTFVAPEPIAGAVSPLMDSDEADLGDLSVVKLRNQNELFELTDTNIIQPDPDSNVRSEDLNFTKYTSIPTPTDAAPEDLATHMRIAAVMLTQLDNPASTLPQDQSAAIKARIIASMQELQDNFGYSAIQMVKGQAGDRKLENDLKVGGFQNNNETTYLGEDWETKKARVRKESPFGDRENWDLYSVISKTGDDLRQEAFACQLIQAMSKAWKADGVGVWVKKMRILITSASTGLVETITNALSVHSIKKALTEITIADGSNPKGTVALLTLHFRKVFGEPGTVKYMNAQSNFAASLASYSLICYLLQIKDRHNGNIMLDNEGHIIHIDFGFLLSNSPGSVGFEAAPFKLTAEYVEILGGLEGEHFLKFKSLLKKAFLTVRKHSDHIIQMVELMQKESNLPCFKAGEQTSVQLKQRFQLSLSDEECDVFVETFLIQKSIGSLYTRLYDQFQLLTQGIYS